MVTWDTNQVELYEILVFVYHNESYCRYFVLYYAVNDGFNFVLWNIQMKATEQYFYVVLFIMLYKVVLTFESVDETLVCDHSNESY